MLIDFDEILHDLELKRAAAAGTDDTFRIDVAAALSGHDGLAVELVLVEEDGGEQPLTPTLIAAPVADALAILALASGEPGVDTTAGRAIIRAITGEVARRLDGAARDGAQRITAHDLSALVEASLIAAGYLEVAKDVLCQPPVFRRGDGLVRYPERR